jgi:hypothetical protein
MILLDDNSLNFLECGSISIKEYLSGDNLSELGDEEQDVPKGPIKVLVIEPLKKPQEVEIGSDLKSMQNVVAGYIEAVYPWEDRVALVCNEEGKINNLPLNRRVGEDIICGTFFICGIDDHGNFLSLNEEQMKHYTKAINKILRNPFLTFEEQKSLLDRAQKADRLGQLLNKMQRKCSKKHTKHRR